MCRVLYFLTYIIEPTIKTTTITMTVTTTAMTVSSLSLLSVVFFFVVTGLGLSSKLIVRNIETYVLVLLSEVRYGFRFGISYDSI